MKLKDMTSEQRKEIPLHSLFTYFPDALVEVVKQSVKGHRQHWPDKPLSEMEWRRDTSSDDKDALCRHIADGDWAAVAWRALAVCQKETENEEAR